MPTRLLTLFAIAVFACLPVQVASAADSTISVAAVGEIKVKPDTVVFTGAITESSQKMKDAMTAFRDTRRRAMASIKEMEIANLSVESGALSIEVAGQNMGGGPFGDVQGEPKPEGSLTLSQVVTLKVTGLDKMEDQAVIDLVVGMLDAAREAGIKQTGADQEAMMMMRMGMGMPSSSAAVFQISEPKSVRQNATRAAMDKARADAQFLAELAGGKLGKVVAVSETAVSDDDEGMNPYMMIWGMMMDGDDSDAYSSPAYQPIVVARGLNVTFELITE